MNSRTYEGQELELFLRATHWKSYWSDRLRPHLGEAVLEVGAGFGSNTSYLCSARQKRWVCLEPDQALASQIGGRLSDAPWRSIVTTVVGTLTSLPPTGEFDTLAYIDVLEHIEADRVEMEKAAGQLRAGGKVVVLSPAHPFLFTDFDRSIGHFRRYTKASLRRLQPPGLQLDEIYYLDSMGMLASLANKLLLRQSMPTPGQIRFWDEKLVPCSRALDPFLGFGLGKTIVGIWVKQ